MARSLTSNKLPTSRMRIRLVADAVELQVRVSQASIGGRLSKLRTLGELDAVRGGLHAIEANFPRVADRVQEVWRNRRLAARELHRHLPPGLDRDRIVEQGFDVVPVQLVNEAHLVRIHEATDRTSCCTD